MSRTKELFMEAHERLIEEYLERNPNATEEQAYEKTSDLAYDRMREDMFDRADYLRMKQKEGQ